jgi:hypothetical protein
MARLYRARMRLSRRQFEDERTRSNKLLTAKADPKPTPRAKTGVPITVCGLASRKRSMVDLGAHGIHTQVALCDDRPRLNLGACVTMILSINTLISRADLRRNLMPSGECRVRQLLEGAASGVRLRV